MNKYVTLLYIKYNLFQMQVSIIFYILINYEIKLYHEYTMLNSNVVSACCLHSWVALMHLLICFELVNLIKYVQHKQQTAF